MTISLLMTTSPTKSFRYVLRGDPETEQFVLINCSKTCNHTGLELDSITANSRTRNICGDGDSCHCHGNELGTQLATDPLFLMENPVCKIYRQKIVVRDPNNHGANIIKTTRVKDMTLKEVMKANKVNRNKCS